MSQASGFSDCSTRFHILPACVQNPAWTHSVVVNKSQKSARDKRLNCPKGFKVPWFGSIKVNLLTCPVTEWFCSLSDHIGIEHTALMGYFLISRYHIRRSAPLSLQISQAIRGTLPVTIWTIRKHSDLHGAIRHIWFSFLFFLHGHLQPLLCFSFSKFFTYQSFYDRITHQFCHTISLPVACVLAVFSSEKERKDFSFSGKKKL